jgi:hypothetical protein
MAENPDDRIAEGKLDLVPMIDCIMLLLLFFILTTKFSSEEKSISSLLPTDKGQMASTPKDIVKPPEQVNICIFPAGLDRGLQPSEYAQKLREIEGPRLEIPSAWIRIGKADPVQIESKLLKGSSGPDVVNTVELIHKYISDELAKNEGANPSDRKGQSPVIINCFSGMSWKYALVAYDAVRAYEGRVSGYKVTGDPTKDFDQAREVDFAPPRIRDYDSNELGNELFEIVNMK